MGSSSHVTHTDSSNVNQIPSTRWLKRFVHISVDDYFALKSRFHGTPCTERVETNENDFFIK